jgi:hypothetical protein
MKLLHLATSSSTCLSGLQSETLIVDINEKQYISSALENISELSSCNLFTSGAKGEAACALDNKYSSEAGIGDWYNYIALV